MKAQDVMTKNLFCIGSEQSLNDAAQLMWDRDCGSAPVVNGDNQVVAMITDRDIAMAAYIAGNRLADIPIETAMSQQLVCCKADDDIGEVQHLMQVHRLHRIPVVDDQLKPLGIISLNDIASTCKSGSRQVKPKDVSDTLAAICGPIVQKNRAAGKAAAA
jgi:CBS domain-containing protein